MDAFLFGTAIIKEERVNDRSGELLQAEISYAGSFEIGVPVNRKGDFGECFAKIPGTNLTTKNHSSLSALKLSLVVGCVVK